MCCMHTWFYQPGYTALALVLATIAAILATVLPAVPVHGPAFKPLYDRREHTIDA